MGSKPHRIDLLVSLIFKPNVNDVLGKDIPLKEKLMILLQSIYFRKCKSHATHGNSYGRVEVS